MNYLDLFSGIGGFTLGAYWAGLRFERHYFSEIDPWCCALYQRRFPDAVPLGDIRKIDGKALLLDADRGRHLGIEKVKEAGVNEMPFECGSSEWILTGGFPCQDISVAGKGAGIGGARSGLWFEYARLIGEIRPRYAIMENVGALTRRGLDRVLGSLAEIGYDAEWSDIRASDVGAPHRRERIWIVAYPGRERRGEGRTESQRREGQAISVGSREAVADAKSSRLAQRDGDSSTAQRPQQSGGEGGLLESIGAPWSVEPDVGRVAHGVPAAMDISPMIEYIQEHGSTRQVEMAKEATENGSVDKVRVMRLYVEVATTSRFLEEAGNRSYSLSSLPHERGQATRKMGDWEQAEGALRGLPQVVHSPGFSRSQDVQSEMPVDPWEVQRQLAVALRVDRLRGLGNAIVPQIAEMIFRGLEL